MTNYGPNQSLDPNTSFERSLPKLSENHKIIEIGSTLLKLWLLKDDLPNNQRDMNSTVSHHPQVV